MSTISPGSAHPSRESPSVGGFRRGSRVRTTVAGTWFPALAPDGTPAGLLLLHPAVEPGGLAGTLTRLAALDLPGALPTRPGLVEQAGRNWLVATAAVTPTVADLLDDGPHRSPANAAALLAEVADTLAEAHAAGLAHGAIGAHAVVVGPSGTALLADWGTDEHAAPEADRRAWATLADLLADRWCAGAPTEAALLTGAARAAEQDGPDGGLDAALEWLEQLAEGVEREALVTAAAAPVTSSRHRRTDDLARRAALVEQEIDGWEPAAPAAGPAPRFTRDAPARRRWPGPRSPVLAVGLAAVLVAGLVAGLIAMVAVLIRPSGPEPDPALAYGPLEVRAVQVVAELRASICVAIGTVTTNGRPGRVVYRWIGENGSQAVSTVSSGTAGQLELGIVWAPSSSPVNGNSVTLQILEPTASTTSAKIPLVCI